MKKKKAVPDNIAAVARKNRIEPELIYYRMHRKGMTLEQAIAHGRGMNREFLRRIDDGDIRPAYPRIIDYMREHKLTLNKFADKAGVARVTIATMLEGITIPNKSTIDKVLNATGMTYEEAFKTE